MNYQELINNTAASVLNNAIRRAPFNRLIYDVYGDYKSALVFLQYRAQELFKKVDLNKSISQQCCYMRDVLTSELKRDLYKWNNSNIKRARHGDYTEREHADTIGEEVYNFETVGGIDPAAIFERHEQIDVIMRIVETLKPLHRDTIKIYINSEYNKKLAADRLGITRNALSMRLKRARAELVEAVNKKYKSGF